MAAAFRELMLRVSSVEYGLQYLQLVTEHISGSFDDDFLHPKEAISAYDIAPYDGTSRKSRSTWS